MVCVNLVQQQKTLGIVRNPVCPWREYAEIGIFTGISERPQQLHGMLHVYILVHAGVDQKQTPFQFACVMGNGAVCIAILIITQLAHIAFGVNGIVEPPVGNRGCCYARTEYTGVQYHCESCHISAITVSANGHPVAINPWPGSQIVGCFRKIAGFRMPQIPVDYFLEITTIPAAAPVVHAGHNPALLCQILYPAIRFELIVNRLGSGTAINVKHKWVLQGFIETGWFYYVSVQFCSVGSCKGEEFSRCIEMVFGEL